MSSTQKSDGKFGTVLSSDSRYQSRSIIFLWLKVVKTLSWRFFILLFEQMAMQKIIIIICGHSLFSKFTQMMTSAAEKHEHVKKVCGKSCFDSLMLFWAQKILHGPGHCNLSLYGGPRDKTLRTMLSSENTLYFIISFLILYPNKLRET